MAKLTGHNSGNLWLIRTRREIDRDPECEVFHSIWRKERIKETDLAVLAGLSGSTVKNLFSGHTRRPQHQTFSKMASALGYKYGLSRDGEKPDYETEVPKAREEFKEYKALLAKRRGKQNGHKKNGHRKG